MTTNPVAMGALPFNPMLAGARTATTEANDALGQDAFMKLLVAQLKYQDPLNPADGADFLAQTAQFTVVEKLSAMQKQGEAAILSQQQMQAVNLVGKQVSYLDAAGLPARGVVESAQFSAAGQTLTIDGAKVQLGSVMEVIRDTSSVNIADVLAELGPYLSASTAAAVREALLAASSGADTTDAVAVGEE